MYFSKISLRQDACSLKKLNQYIHKNGYYYHQLIWDLFADAGNKKLRDFIYRAEFDGNWPNFYAVSATKPMDENNIWRIDSKEYRPKIKEGDFLFFMLRANPRICRKKDAEKHVYFDVVQDALYQQKTTNANKKLKIEIIQEVGTKWLNNRDEKNGFIIKPESVIADNFQKHRFEKSKHPNAICFSTLDFRGRLQVVDTEKFIHALCHGIGAAKGFGCGLLMVKR